MIALLGWNHGFIAARSQIQLTHIATVATVDASGNIAHPGSGIEAGDFLVYVAYAAEFGTTDPPSMGTPSGYTLNEVVSAAPGGSNGTRLINAYKIATGTEDGTSINVSSSGGVDAEAAAILQFRPSQPIGTVEVIGSDIEMTINNPSPQTIGGTDIRVNLHVGFYVAGVVPTSRSMSPTEDAETTLTVNGAADGYVKYKLFNPPDTAVAVTADMGDHGLNALAHFAYLLNPA